MAIIKCKMCGGDMELSADKSYGTCEYCGSTMTLPRVDDEQRAAAFNRGNHFRRIGEFDKALAVYERMVQEDETDAEAHWCCALCRFGIEYVQDPASGEYLPTCHRASFDSFLEDVDYQAALKYADAVARKQYEKDGEQIAEVQRGILAISRKEQPFDVFLCYKENDDAGNRTVDSTLAQEIYYELTEQGRRVFFARITLEDKAGQEYEPYIFAALHSAKVMVVVGTKPEYLNAVWVKNEWSRYLSLMKTDRKRLLIPCYRDMDPYDLPEQLSVLQAYDMGKIGFLQDLTRGISKVLDADKKPEPTRTAGGNANAAALLRRAQIFLEDGEWDEANEYFDKVLDQLPECAEAYWGKTLASTRCATAEEYIRAQQKPPQDQTERLDACPMDGARIQTIVEKYQIPLYLEADTLRKDLTAIDRGFDSVTATRRKALEEKERVLSQHKLLSRAVRYADGQLADQLRDVQDQILSFYRSRLEASERQDEACRRKGSEAYQAELDRMEQDIAVSYADAQKTLSEGYAKACADFEKHMQETYDTGAQLRALSKVFEALAGVFRALGPYRDSPDYAEKCDRRAAELVEEAKAADQAAKERKEQEAAEAKAKAKARKRRNVLIGIAAVVVVAVLITLTVKVFVPAGKVSKAEKLIAAGSDQGAYDILSNMDPYGDSEAMLADISQRAGYRVTGTVVETGDDEVYTITPWYNEHGDPILVRYEYEDEEDDFDYLFEYTYYDSGNPESCTITRTDESNAVVEADFYDVPEAGLFYAPQGYLRDRDSNDIYGLQYEGDFTFFGAREVRDRQYSRTDSYNEDGTHVLDFDYTVEETLTGKKKVDTGDYRWEYDKYGKLTEFVDASSYAENVYTSTYEGDEKKPSAWRIWNKDSVKTHQSYTYDESGNLKTMHVGADGNTDREITWEWMVFADAEPAPEPMEMEYQTLKNALYNSGAGDLLEEILGGSMDVVNNTLTCTLQFNTDDPAKIQEYAEKLDEKFWKAIYYSGEYIPAMRDLLKYTGLEDIPMDCTYVDSNGKEVIYVTMEPDTYHIELR